MKRALLIPLLLIAGTGVGGAAAVGAAYLNGAPAPSAGPTPSMFVSAGDVLSPMVFADGRLAGYVSFALQLEVDPDQEEFVRERLPMLLHAINLRTFRTPLASGPAGELPNLAVFRRVVLEAAPEAFGPDVVRSVAITQARPA